MTRGGQLATGELLQMRWLLIEQAQNSLPPLRIVILLFWLTVLHASFGVRAPRNLTSFTVLLISAISLSGPIFLILEMNHPLEGMFKVPSVPLGKALQILRSQMPSFGFAREGLDAQRTLDIDDGPRLKIPAVGVCNLSSRLPQPCRIRTPHEKIVRCI